MKVLRIGYKLLLVCILTACGSDDAVRSDQTAENTDERASDRSLADVLSPEMFSAMFLHQAETACNASAFTYESLIRAAGQFPAFGTTGSDEARRREVAAFLANVSHETTGGGPRRRTARSPGGCASERNWPAEERPARAPRPTASPPRPTFPASAGRVTTVADRCS